MQPEESGGPCFRYWITVCFSLVVVVSVADPGSHAAPAASRASALTSSVIPSTLDPRTPPLRSAQLRSFRGVNAGGPPFPLEGTRNLATALLSSRHGIFQR
ncbi:hypothetical protein MRX96_039762 [Rhipicephalus microplus]